MDFIILTYICTGQTVHKIETERQPDKEMQRQINRQTDADAKGKKKEKTVTETQW